MNLKIDYTVRPAPPVAISYAEVMDAVHSVCTARAVCDKCEFKSPVNSMCLLTVPGQTRKSYADVERVAKRIISKRGG